MSKYPIVMYSTCTPEHAKCGLFVKCFACLIYHDKCIIYWLWNAFWWQKKCVFSLKRLIHPHDAGWSLMTGRLITCTLVFLKRMLRVNMKGWYIEDYFFSVGQNLQFGRNSHLEFSLVCNNVFPWGIPPRNSLTCELSNSWWQRKKAISRHKKKTNEKDGTGNRATATMKWKRSERVIEQFELKCLNQALTRQRGSLVPPSPHNTGKNDPCR